MGKLREMTLWVHEKGVKKKGKKEKRMEEVCEIGNV